MMQLWMDRSLSDLAVCLKDLFGKLEELLQAMTLAYLFRELVPSLE